MLKRKKNIVFKNQKCLAGRDGFSIIEVVASFSIIGIGFTALLFMFGTAGKSSALSQERVIAANLIQFKIEEIKCKPYSTNVTETGAAYTGFSEYLIDVTEAPHDPDSQGLALKKVVVTIRWNSALGGAMLSDRIPFLIAEH